MINLEQNKTLAPLTTFGIGGGAKYFTEVRNEDELLEALEYAQKEKLEILVLGGGSNILISDSGFDGLVILNRIKGVKVHGDAVTVGAGEDWDELVVKTIENNLVGIENLSGIPGTVGGAVVQNIGAYDQTFGDTVDFVNVINCKTLIKEQLKAADCHFAYRNSVFKENIGNYAVTSVQLKLNVTENSESLHKSRNKTLTTRAQKGMLISDEVESYRSAGSYFKNPIIAKDHFDNVFEGIKDTPPDKAWFWEVGADKVKLSAAYLIELSGFKKGYENNGAGISPKHNLSLINVNNATAQSVDDLALAIKKAVAEKFRVNLEEEVIKIGSFK
ncbi:MAG: UDP-N-acetylmuramate dehydrogenase [Candidatus Doudnabacteria bacterium]